MSTLNGVDDDIRADFLIEAGELVENLGGQLVALESRPGDSSLLNAIFRAFHTVKGGAGFLALDPLVAVCHAAEEVFNALRAGKRSIDAPLMDAVLQALDQLQAMMRQVGQGQAPQAAPPALLSCLHGLAHTAAITPAPVAAAVLAAPPAAVAGDSISEDEFDALLDELQGIKRPSPSAPPPAAAAVKIEAVAAAVTAAEPVPPPRSVEPAGKGGETSVRVDTARLDQMMNLVGELVLVRNRLKALHGAAADQQGRAIRELDHITREMQAAVLRTRMQPIGRVFSRFPKLVRDLARGLGKQVELELYGEDTDLDKNLVEALADPLTHMLRNGVDHGIEMPDQRLRAGKPALGKLRLSAEQESDHILIRVQDDGAGMDAERLRTKAVQKGLLGSAEAAALSADECLQLVFLPGFSTKEQVTDLSGRGVGMDVVKSAITRLHGSVSIDSRPGQGSSIQIRVPLTLAILPALMVEVRGRRLALPLALVAEVFALDAQRMRRLDCWDIAPLARENLRLVHLAHWIAPRQAPGEPGRHVIAVRVGDARYGLVVDQVRGREEVVIKPLGGLLRGLAGLAGATVTPEGRVALILDVPSLIQAFAQNAGYLPAQTADPAVGQPLATANGKPADKRG